MGPVAERRGSARTLAAELIQRADALMYEAKSRRSDRVHVTAVAVEDGQIVDITERASSVRRTQTPLICPRQRANARIQSYSIGVLAADLGHLATSAFSSQHSAFPYGGCSSAVERRTVAPEVAGSNPVIHPKSKSAG